MNSAMYSPVISIRSISIGKKETTDGSLNVSTSIFQYQWTFPEVVNYKKNGRMTPNYIANCQLPDSPPSFMNSMSFTYHLHVSGFACLEEHLQALLGLSHFLSCKDLHGCGYSYQYHIHALATQTIQVK